MLAIGGGGGVFLVGWFTIGCHGGARKYAAEVRDTSFLGGSSVRRSKKILERISITVIPC